MASAGLAAFLGTVQTADAQVTDADILQFALNREYLEAEFYTMARMGKSISEMGVYITGSGATRATTGGKQVTFIERSTLAKIEDEIGAGGRTHVALLRCCVAP